MKEKIISNILSSSVEKISILGTQFIASIIIIRFLERQDYGIIGIVAGYYVFVNFINISTEAIILRDHRNYDSNLNGYMINFFAFNIIKSLVFIFIAVILCFVLPHYYANSNFIYSIVSITIILIADSTVAPLVIYASSKFFQKTVTKISLIRAILNLILLGGLLFYPTLKYLAIKDAFVSIIFVLLWFYIAKRNFSINVFKKSYLKHLDLAFIKESLLSYSLWTHLIGIVTNFIYKSDPFFLSFFVSLSVVGNYNIALNSANIANIFPSILNYQNSIALSHVKDDPDKAIRINNIFLKYSFLVGFCTLIFFVFFGQMYIFILTGATNNDEIYFYMLCIVTGLVIVKTITSPLSSFIGILGSVKSMFINVCIPAFIITALAYYISVASYGTYGIAIANILISIFLALLFIREVKKYNYVFWI